MSMTREEKVMEENFTLKEKNKKLKRVMGHMIEAIELYQTHGSKADRSNLNAVANSARLVLGKEI